LDIKVHPEGTGRQAECYGLKANHNKHRQLHKTAAADAKEAPLLH